MAAGIAAAFNAPISAVTFTIEEIVGTLDQTVLSGVVVAAAMAAVIERSVLGAEPVIHLERAYALDHASSLPLYALLGICAAFVSILFTDAVLELRLAFRKLNRPPRWSHPALGGLVTGVIAVLVMRFLKSGGVNGGGYQAMGEALAGHLGVQVLVALCLAKVCATAFSYSSGGSGGVFAPALCIGAMVGGVLGWVDVAALGHGDAELGAFAVVGMGAAFAGIIRAPITSVLIIFEMTGGYGLVLPLMISNMIAYGLARHFRPTPLYDALLEQDGVHLAARDSAATSLEHLPVERAMTRAPIVLGATQTVGEGVESLKGKTFSLCPVLDGGRLFGAVTLIALRKAAAEGAGDRPVSTLTQPAETVSVGTPLRLAAARMSRAAARQLLVLDEQGRLAGLLAMSDVLNAHARAAAPDDSSGRVPPDDALLAIKVGLLAVEAVPVTAATPLPELLDLLIAARGGALPVEGAPGGQCAVATLESVRELRPDDEALGPLLVAADVGKPVRPISPAADLLQALRAMDEQNVDALPVVDGPAGTAPYAVLTRADLGRFLFSHYARGAR
ncbi:MAG: chloride channel protein [Archangiaceae bacterium]|nr:chloride channel protein [Archangiaceae bacterium]